LNQLKKIKKLNLHGNLINTIEGLDALRLLEKLRIGDNPIPNELLKKCGGIDEKGYAYEPQKFVEHCKKMGD